MHLMRHSQICQANNCALYYLCMLCSDLFWGKECFKIYFTVVLDAYTVSEKCPWAVILIVLFVECTQMLAWSVLSVVRTFVAWVVDRRGCPVHFAQTLSHLLLFHSKGRMDHTSEVRQVCCRCQKMGWMCRRVPPSRFVINCYSFSILHILICIWHLWIIDRWSHHTWRRHECCEELVQPAGSCQWHEWPSGQPLLLGPGLCKYWGRWITHQRRWVTHRGRWVTHQGRWVTPG